MKQNKELDADMPVKVRITSAYPRVLMAPYNRTHPTIWGHNDKTSRFHQNSSASAHVGPVEPTPDLDRKFLRSLVWWSVMFLTDTRGRQRAELWEVWCWKHIIYHFYHKTHQVNNSAVCEEKTQMSRLSEGLQCFWTLLNVTQPALFTLKQQWGPKQNQAGGGLTACMLLLGGWAVIRLRHFVFPSFVFSWKCWWKIRNGRKTVSSFWLFFPH